MSNDWRLLAEMCVGGTWHWDRYWITLTQYLTMYYTPLTDVEYLYNLELGLQYFINIFYEGM